MAEMLLYGDIDDWVANAINAFVDENPNDAIIRINSVGGDVFQAIPVYNVIKDKNVTTIVDGLAASAATVIAFSGAQGKRKAYQYSFFLYHFPWGMRKGNSEDLTKSAEELKKVQDALVDMALKFANAKGKTRDDVESLFRAETLLTAQEAMDWGFVDEIIAETNESVAASSQARIKLFIDSLDVKDDVKKRFYAKAQINNKKNGESKMPGENNIANDTSALANVQADLINAKKEAAVLNEKITALTTENASVKAKIEEQTLIIAKFEKEKKNQEAKDAILAKYPSLVNDKFFSAKVEAYASATEEKKAELDADYSALNAHYKSLFSEHGKSGESAGFKALDELTAEELSQEIEEYKAKNKVDHLTATTMVAKLHGGK